MANQAPFTEYEAVILLNAYLKVLSGDLTRMDSVRECSAKLRQMAINAGVKIDSVYRNVNGISWQMASMESAYQGHTILKPATRLFQETVLLFWKENDKYQALLQEAERMVSGQQDDRAVFLSWLSKYVSRAQFSNRARALNEVERQAKKMKWIEDSLFENLDLHFVRKLQSNIESSILFKFTHRKQWNAICTVLKDLLQFSIQKVAEKKPSKAITTIAVAGPGEEGTTFAEVPNASDKNKNRMEVEKINLQKDFPKVKASSTMSLTDVEMNPQMEFTKSVTRSFNKENVKYGNKPNVETFQTPQKNQIQGSQEKFYHWMKEVQFMSENTCRSYLSAIRGAERFAQEHALSSQKLYTEDAAEARATADALFVDPDFIEHNREQHNRFRAAITKLLAFYGCSWSPNERKFLQENEGKSPQDAAPSIDATPYVEILVKYFRKGYRLSSHLDMKKLRRYYEDSTGKELNLDQETLETAIKKCGVVYDGKLYMPQTMLSEKIKEQILSFIEKRFEEGGSAIYYEAIFQTFSNELLNSKIFNVEMLKAYLSYCIGNKYYVGKSYISKTHDTEVDPIEEVRQCLLEYDAPVKVDKLCERLPHIDKTKIRSILESSSEFVRNSKGEYFHADSLHLTEEELENIATVVASGIAEHEFISGNELYDAIQKKYPNTFEKNSIFSRIGWRDALKYKLGDQFSFVGNIISRAGTSISMSDVFAEYGRRRPKFSLDELNQFANSIGSTIYFDALYTHAIRISYQWFVEKSKAWFSIEETDNVLDRFCTGPYMPIRAVSEFVTFPDASFPWTEYLLEQYVAFYSEKFYLLHSQYNKNCVVGAIVRQSCLFDSFDDLLADLLAGSGIPLRKKEALDYLAENGYIARRSYTNIETLILNARAKRNQKEK